MHEHKNETMNKFFVSLGLRSLAADQEAEIVRQAFEQVSEKPGVNEVNYREVWERWIYARGHVPAMAHLTEAIKYCSDKYHYRQFRTGFLGALQVATMNGDFNQ